MVIYVIIGIVVALLNAKTVFKMLNNDPLYKKLEDVLRKIPKVGKALVVIEPAILAFEIVMIWPLFIMIDIFMPILLMINQKKTIEKYFEAYNKCDEFLDSINKDIDEFNELN